MAQKVKKMFMGLLMNKQTNLQPFDHLLEVLHVAAGAPERDAITALVEHPQGIGAAQLPANHVFGGTVEHYGLDLLVHQNQEIVGHGQEALQLASASAGSLVLDVHRPGDAAQTTLLSAGVRPALLLLLVGQRNEGELARGVNGRAGGVALSQVTQVLLAGARGHRTELVRLVRRVLGVDHLGQQEVPEHRGLGEGHALWDGRAKGGHVLGARYGHAAGRGEGWDEENGYQGRRVGENDKLEIAEKLPYC